MTSITYKLGKRTRIAGGTATWKAAIPLKPGRNVIRIIAHGPGGDSAPKKIVVLRE